ncbi:MAG: ATPase, T2SS/T4P/T4SS family [Myxococcota bacterium]
MFAVVITEKGGAQRRVEFDKNEVTIGRVQGNDIILPKGNVSKRHSRIVLKDDRFIVVDLKSTNGTYVNGRKITSPLVIKPGDKIYIGDFILAIEGTELPEEVDEGAVEELPSNPAVAASPEPETRTAPPATPAREERTHQRTTSASALEGPTAHYPSRGGPTDPRALRPDADRALSQLMKRVATVFDVHNTDARALFDEDRRASAKSAIEAAIREMDGEGLLDGTVDRTWLAAAAVREAVGLGDLEPLMANENVREIVVETPTRFLADMGGGLQRVDGRFSSAAAAMTVAQRLLGQAGEPVDPKAPIREMALPHGPHVTVVQPPVAVHGPVIEIRRMAPGLSMDDLVHLGALSEEMRALLARAVGAHRHVVVVGPAGSGVTTVLGALASLVPGEERILTVEAVPDLSIGRESVVSLSSGGTGRIDLRELIQKATLLRADRLVIDDLRGAELLDALAALSARQGGGLLGVHAALEGGPVDALRTLARLERQVPDATLHTLLARGAHLLVQVARTDDGRRRVVGISETVPTAGGTKTRDLFAYDGGFSATGQRPSF